MAGLAPTAPGPGAAQGSRLQRPGRRPKASRVSDSPGAAAHPPALGTAAGRTERGIPCRAVPYQLLLQGGEGGLQTVLLAVGRQGLLLSARRRPLRHGQGGPHQLPLLLPKHLELLEAGESRLQPLAHPAAIPAARPRGAQQHGQRWAAAPAMAGGRRGGCGAAPAPGRACAALRSAAGTGASEAEP